MQTSQGIDFSTLSWVRSSIDETLTQARDALENHVRDPEDSAALPVCIAALHQIKGTLTVMQTQTAAQLAGEMEATAAALAEGRVKDRDEAHEGLMRAILQIPDYLEWLQSGKPDRPQVLQPLIDDLRRARGEVVAAPALQAVATPEAKPDQEVRTLAGRVRPLYQSGLVHLLRDKPDADGTRRMLQALDMLARTCRLTQANRLWVLAGGHLESATHAGATLELTDKRLLGQIDREMKRLAEEGEHALEYSPNLGLLDNLTALLQAGSATGTRASAARKLIQTLKDAAPVAASGDADDSAADQSVLSGVNAQVLETVSAAIREDLAGIKDALDLYARSPHPDANDLAVLREPLRKIADTLNVIGLRSAHAVVADMGVVIKEAVESKRNLQDPAQLGLATAVLFVEAALNALSGGRSEVDGDADEVLSSLQRARDPDQADVRKVSYSALPDAEFQQVADAVMREAHIDIGRSKDAIAAFIDSPFDANILADTPELFDRISGALGLLGQTRAASLTRAVQVYLERRLLRGGDLPKRSELEDLADAISGIEYFLEAKQLKRRDAEQVLDVSEQSLKQLGYPFPEEDERPVEPDAEIDDDAFLADLPELDALTALSPTGSEFPDLPDIDDEGVSTDSSHPDPTEYSDTSRAEDLAWDTTGESLDDDWPHDAAIDDVTSGDIPVTVSNVPELEGEADPDILEIFLEEAGEERQRIAELLPAWRKNPEDMERVGELRRAYHTLKGSGRMVGAARLGEFAWGVEDLLNRVMDGAVPCDDRLLETITEASEHALPELIARLSDPDVTASADLDLLAAQLAALRSPGSVWPERGETSAAASISAEPVPPATADGQIQADEVIALDAPEMDAVDYEEPDSMPTGDDMVADLGAELIPDQGSADTDRDEEVISSGSDSPHSDDEDEDGPRLDPVLYDIFSKELLGHLDTLDDFVATTREQGFPGRPSAELRRALHTILGSTRTTGITELADLAGPLDTYIKDAGVNDESLTDADVEIVSESSRLFRDSIAHINEPGFRFPNIGPVLDRISEAFAARAKARAEGPIDVDDETILGLTAEDLTENQHDETASEVDTDPTPEESVERLAPEPAGEADADTDAESGAQIDAAESGLADILDAQESLPDELLGDEDAAPATIDASPIASSDEPLSQSSENATTAAEFDQLEAFDPGGFDAPSLSDETLPDAQEDDQSSFDATVVESTDDQAPETEQFDPMSLTEALQDTAPELDAAQFADEEPPAEDVEAHAALDVDDAAEDLAAASTNAGHFVVDTDSDLLDLFLEESAEILDAAESDLTHLQRHPDDAATVASLQRGLHTLKGGARMVGLTPIGDLSHALETLFESMAGGKVQADDIAARLLNQCFDRLLTMSVEARSGYITSAADLTDAVDALTRGERPNLPLEVGESVSESRDAQHDESASVGVEMAEEAVPEDQDAPAPSTSEPATAQAEAAAPKEATGRQEPARGEQIRVRAEVLGNLVNLAGEVSIFRSRLEQQLGSFQFNITELDQTVSRVRDQLRKLEIETEAQILSRYHTEAGSGADSDFDPLELDRFSQLQQLSRALSEGINDLLNIQSSLDGLTGETETLLRQQSRVNTELQEGLMGLRMVPFTSVEPRLRRIVRQTSQELGKKVELKIVGGGSEIDRTILERMTAPLEHMLRNAISHGLEAPQLRAAAGKPETGEIVLRLAREGADVVIEVRDDGAGVNLAKLRQKAIERGMLRETDTLPDHELMQFLLESGFSTAESVSQIAGRGVGMDVVRSEVRQLSGTLDIDSIPGRGAWFTIRLPFTLSVNKALLITVGDDPYAIPLAALDGVIRLSHEALQRSYGSDTPLYEYAGNSYALMHLGNLLGVALPTIPDEHDRVPVLLVRAGDQRVALQVDGLVGSREIVVKSLGAQLSSVPGIAGATILGDGRVVLILELGTLVRIGRTARAERITEIAERKERDEPRVSVMVVDDSITMRKVATRLLERHNVHVLTAKDGIDALSQLQDVVPDVMLLDIEMPRMDGFELASHMRRDDRLKGVPIVMITSRTGDKHRDRAAEIGIDEYMGKPYKENDLLQTILGIANKNRDADQ